MGHIPMIIGEDDWACGLAPHPTTGWEGTMLARDLPLRFDALGWA